MIIFLSTTIASFAQKADDIIGNWLTSDGARKINVYKQDEMYYGKIYWVNNEDKKTEISKIVMLKMSFIKNEYENGTFIMPSDKHSANCSAKIIENKVLQITIYHGLKLFGHSIYLSKLP